MRCFEIQHQSPICNTWFPHDLPMSVRLDIAIKTYHDKEKLKQEYIKLAQDILKNDNRFTRVRVLEVEKNLNRNFWKGRCMKIRLWKLGSLEHKILPTKESVEKLNKILSDSVGKDGTLDLIWGPELTLEVYDDQEPITDVLKIEGAIDTKIPKGT
jgi:hypothetical protein